MKINKKIQFFTSKWLKIILTTGIVITGFHFTKAAFDASLTFPTCSLGIYPYSATGDIVGPYEADWFKLFQGKDDPVCAKYLKYPDQYKQPPDYDADENKLVKSGVEKKSAPVVQHNHIYHNATKEDEFFYKSYIDSFQIILKEDARKNTDLGKIICRTPDEPKKGGKIIETPGCNTTAAIDAWGGTAINFNKETGIITWKFAASGTGRPILWGNNPTLDKEHGLWGATVKLASKDNSSEKIWSATTISRALVRNVAIKNNGKDWKEAESCQKDKGKATEPTYDGYWCTVRAPSIPGVEATTTIDGKEYYWFQMGIVASVWKTPPPPPPPPDVCVDEKFEVFLDGVPLTKFDITADASPVILKASGLKTSGKIIEKMIWSTTDGNLETIKGSGCDDIKTGSTLKDVSFSCSVKFTSGSAISAIVSVSVSPPESGVCKRDITIEKPVIPPPPPKVCTSLTISPSAPKEIEAGKSFEQKFDVKVETIGDPKLEYQWSTTSSKGAFDKAISTDKSTTYKDPSPDDGTIITVKTIYVDTRMEEPACTASVKLKKTPPPPPPPPTKACIELKITNKPGEFLADKELEYTFKTKKEVIGDLELRYKWTTTATTGAFNKEKSPFVTDSTEATYRDSAPVDGTIITVTGLDAQARTTPACSDSLELKVKTPPSPSPVCEGLTLRQQNDRVCAIIQGTYTGRLLWTIGTARFDTAAEENCQPVGPDTRVSVFATQVCRYSLTTSISPPPPQPPPPQPPLPQPPLPPELHKAVRRAGTVTAFTQKLTLPQGSEQKVEYQLTLIPKSIQMSANIRDTISEKGFIQGQTNNGPGEKTNFGNNMLITRNGIQMAFCGRKKRSDCYEGNIGDNEGVILRNLLDTALSPVVIKYEAYVNSILTPQTCDAGRFCQEKFENQATADYWFNNREGEENRGRIMSENVTTQIFCQYILTRAAGDIFLEREINAGANIQYCSEFKSTSGVIIKPRKPPERKIISTGAPQTFIITHEVCKSGKNLSEKLEEYYSSEKVSPKLSSQICSVSLQPGQRWKKETIVNSIRENKTRLSRWAPNLNTLAGADNKAILYSFDQLSTSTIASSKGVYHLKGKDLVLGGGGNRLDLTLNDGKGAKTFIVENGDLIIRNNIKYGGCDKPGKKPCTARDTASLAFIVLNGNVYVDPSVQELSGVFFVQKGENNDNGKLISGNPEKSGVDSSARLTIYGSIYGNIEPLLQKRRFAGEPGKDEGSIVIRFDERIILNTPPGLEDVLKLDKAEVAR